MRGIKNLLIGLLAIAFLNGCATTTENVNWSKPIEARSPIQDTLVAMPQLDGPKITIAVYSFQDKTGQRKPNNSFSQLSSAVTQGSEVWVINALQKAGGGTWFTVVERVGLDNLVKERQLIRSTREVYEGKEAIKLKPMLFAGLLLEGGVVGYDSNTTSGGAGARYFGIGASTSYRTDQVTVAMRVVSVQTGEVLLTVACEKTIASHKSGADVFRFLDLGTKALELETGSAVNEPTNYAVRASIEAWVGEIIKQGETKGLWKYKSSKVEHIRSENENIHKKRSE
jgi:curli production assembly/transport component CsgG